MAKNIPRTYRNKRPLKIILTALLSLVIVFVVLTVVLFFGLMKYYDKTSGQLDIPWLTQETAGSPDPS